MKQKTNQKSKMSSRVLWEKGKNLFENNIKFHLVSLVVILGIFSLPLFITGFYESHDGEAHVARFAAYYKAFADGQIIPRWSGDLNYRYGTPVFIFYYPLPGYIASFLHLVGFSFETAFKLLIIASFIACSITFYLWTRTLFDKRVAFIGGLLYGLAPYHFLNLYVRGDIAELLALVFVPLVFLFIEKVIKEQKWSYIIQGGIMYALMVLAHNGISLLFSPIFVFYMLLRTQKIRTLCYSAALLGSGLLLSAFFWLPALYEGKYTNRNLFIGDMYKDHFPTIAKLIYSSWGFGTDVKMENSLSPQVGILYLLFIIIAVYIVLKKNANKLLLGGWLVIFFAAFFITTSFSTIVWQYVPLLKLLEFPWRFTAVSSFAAALLACFVVATYKSYRLYIVTIVVLLISSLPFTTFINTNPRSDDYYLSYPGTTYYHGEASTIWTAGDPGAHPKKSLELIGGKAVISNEVRKSHTHTFVVDAQTDSKILDNTLYFPGWKVYVDGKRVPVEFQDMNHRGLLTFAVPTGKHTVAVLFEETAIRILANSLSMLSAAIIVLIIVGKRIIRR